MKSTPSLSSYNRFNVLYIDPIDNIETKTQNVQNPPPTETPTMTPRLHSRRPKWEKSLPKKYVVSATDDGRSSLKLKVEIETLDTAETKSVSALVDSGATGDIIDRHFAKSCRFNLVKLAQPIPVYNVDGTLNEAGSITEVVNLILRYKGHSERTTFAVSGIGKQKLILGHTWLQKHNPEIDWTSGEVKMSRCPPRCCPGCRDEVRQERIAQKGRKSEERHVQRRPRT